MSDQLTPDALAGAVERVQRWVKNNEACACEICLRDAAYLRVLLACAASHVPEADREQALWHALRAECSDDCHEAEARKLLRLPSQTEQG